MEDNEPKESHTVSKLEDIPDATSYDINVLIARYGEKLRVAVDPEAIFVVLAGSHARVDTLFCIQGERRLLTPYSDLAYKTDACGICCTASHRSRSRTRN